MDDLHKIHVFLLDMERALPVRRIREKKDILRETQSHLMERAQAGRLDEAIDALGAPEAYAAQFSALADPDEGAPRIPAGRVTVRLAAAGLAVILLVPCLVAVVMELLDPAGFGLWVSLDDGVFVFGRTSTSNPRISDVAGHLMLPVSALLSLGLVFSVYLSVRSALLQAVSSAQSPTKAS
ncbi:MAG: hypothetical protein AAF692_03910 [Pseudomonadota bacterium]